MRPAHVVTLSTTVFGVAGGGVLASLFGLATDPSHRGVWLGGLVACGAIAALSGAIALAQALADREEAKELRGRHKMIPLIGMVICGIGLAGFGGWYFWPSATTSASAIPVSARSAVTIESEFSRVRRDFGAALGGHVDAQPVPTQSLTVEAFHQRANVLWMSDLSKAFYIPAAGTGRKATQVDDGGDVGDAQFQKLNWLRAKFDPPAGSFPPQGGVARRWLEDPKKYGWVGWLTYEPRYAAGQISYQRFVGGMIVGPLRRGPSNDLAAMYVIFNNGTVKRPGTALQPAPSDPAPLE